MRDQTCGIDNPQVARLSRYGLDRKSADVTAVPAFPLFRGSRRARLKCN